MFPAFKVSGTRAQLSVSASEVGCAVRLQTMLTLRSRVVIRPSSRVRVDRTGWTDAKM